MPNRALASLLERDGLPMKSVKTEGLWKKKNGRWVPRRQTYPDGTLRPFLPGKNTKIRGKVNSYSRRAVGGSVRVVKRAWRRRPPPAKDIYSQDQYEVLE